MIPFILAGRRKLPPEPMPSTLEHYDPLRQLWVESSTGQPLVNRLRYRVQASQYGETTMTETREGVDQTESVLQASSYGETILTKTHEGADQTEASSWEASSYGEMTMTATREETDKPEGSMDASPYGETIETRTREGTDQREVSSDCTFDACGSSATLEHASPNITEWNSPDLPNAPHPHF